MNPDQAKFLVEHYANLMTGEHAATVKVLAAVRDDNRDYKPDEKSRSAWELATHLATSDIWFLDSIIKGKFELGAEAWPAESQFKTVSDVVDFYQKTFPAKLQQVRSLSPEQMTRSIDFIGMVQAPAAAFLGRANNHSIHHRGQLAAYLRAMGSKVPGIYGPSADEPMQVAG